MSLMTNVGTKTCEERCATFCEQNLRNTASKGRRGESLFCVHYLSDFQTMCIMWHYTYFIIIVIIIITISFMHGIYTYIPETNCVPREYSVAAILLLLFMVLISLVSVLNLLYFYISTFRSMCAVPNMAVFCSSLTS